MKKTIIFLLILLFNSFSIKANDTNSIAKNDAHVMQCPKCGKKFPNDSFQFCNEDGTRLKKIQFMVVNLKKTGEYGKEDKDIGPAGEQKKQVAKQEEIKKEIKETIDNEQKEKIKVKVEENTFDYDKTMKAIREYFDKDKKLALFLLEYIYMRYPADVEVLKLYADFLTGIKQYDKAMELYKKAEEIINGRLKEARRTNEKKNISQ